MSVTARGYKSLLHIQSGTIMCPLVCRARPLESNARQRSLHMPYRRCQESIRSGGMLHELAKSTSKWLLLYCAFGERLAMAVQAAQDAGVTSATSGAASTPGRKRAGSWGP